MVPIFGTALRFLETNEGLSYQQNQDQKNIFLTERKIGKVIYIILLSPIDFKHVLINVYYFFIIVTSTIFFIVAFVTANTITLFITITVNITIVFDHLPTKHTASAFKSFFVVINVYILYLYCKSSGFLPSIWIFDSTHITLMALMINDILKFKKLIEFPSLKIS